MNVIENKIINTWWINGHCMAAGQKDTSYEGPYSMPYNNSTYRSCAQFQSCRKWDVVRLISCRALLLNGGAPDSKSRDAVSNNIPVVPKFGNSFIIHFAPIPLICITERLTTNSGGNMREYLDSWRRASEHMGMWISHPKTKYIYFNSDRIMALLNVVNQGQLINSYSLQYQFD